MQYKKGDRVTHPTVAKWGVGQVLADSNGQTVKVFFEGGGEREISLELVDLIPATTSIGQHAVLDNLRVPQGKGITFRSLTESTQLFLDQFPEGFYGERFMEEERVYKIKAHELAQELLDETSLRTLIEQEDYDEICRRALRVANATNLIFPNEKMALKDGLQVANNKQLFSEALCNLLYRSEPFESRFTRFCDMLKEIGAAKWTIATYFQFIADPKQYMFLKPTVTQDAAEVCAFELNYKPDLNWLTYKSVLGFSTYLREALVTLKPRDMIDIQSFIWCIAPEKELRRVSQTRPENLVDEAV